MILALIFIMSLDAHAQIINYDSDDVDVANSYVGTVDKFIQRFNCEIFLPHFDTTQGDYKEKNLLSLFDGQIFGTMDVKDTRYNDAREFAAEVAKQNVRIKIQDSTWFAIVPCNGTLNEKKIKFVLVLNLEYCGDNMYKWSIAKAIGADFKLTPSIVDKRLKIYPTARNLNFNQLLDINASNDLILNYRQKQYQLDETAVFYAYFYSGQLSIDRIADFEVQFDFYQVPGWKFTVKEFPRESNNAGWLISDFQKMSDEDKEKVLYNIYNTNLPSKPMIIHDTVIKYVPIDKEPNAELFVGDIKMVYINDFIKYNYYIGETDITRDLWVKTMGTNYDFEYEVIRKKANKFLKKLEKQVGKNFRFSKESEYEYAVNKGMIRKGDYHLRLVLVANE